ncbi:hypothetical protein BSLA_02f0179 [Burkholderia stabilis]|nr:hypothetical protein BSLA_02f0179 [Burkholderia stabilis]
MRNRDGSAAGRVGVCTQCGCERIRGHTARTQGDRTCRPARGRAVAERHGIRTGGEGLGTEAPAVADRYRSSAGRRHRVADCNRAVRARGSRGAADRHGAAVRRGGVADRHGARAGRRVRIAKRDSALAVRRVVRADCQSTRAGCAVRVADRDRAVAARRLAAADRNRAAGCRAAVGRRAARADRNVLARPAGDDAVALRNAVRAVDGRAAADRDTRCSRRRDGRLTADRDAVRSGRLRALRCVAADRDRARARRDGRVRLRQRRRAVAARTADRDGVQRVRRRAEAECGRAGTAGGGFEAGCDPPQASRRQHAGGDGAVAVRLRERAIYRDAGPAVAVGVTSGHDRVSAGTVAGLVLRAARVDAADRAAASRKAGLQCGEGIRLGEPRQGDRQCCDCGNHDGRLVRLAPCRIDFRCRDPGAKSFVPDRAVCAVHVLLPPNVHATHRSLSLEEYAVRSRESQN